MNFDEFNKANDRHQETMQACKFALAMADPQERDLLERSIIHQYLSTFLQGFTDSIKLNPVNVSLALSEAGGFTREVLEAEGLWPSNLEPQAVPKRKQEAGYL